MTDHSSLSDLELIDLLKSADQGAFTEIYNRNWGFLYLHALKLLQSEDEAKDVVQDVFIALWRQSSGLVIKGGLSAYLFIAVRNKVLNAIRDKKVRTNYTDLFSLYIEAHSNVIIEKIEEKELLLAIEKVIQSLPEKMRLIFELSRKEHFAHKEIATQLQISEKTVKRQISNALTHLRVQLNKPENLILAIIYTHIK